MKNLKLSIKVGILVAVLLATVLIVAFVAVKELAHLDDRFEAMANVTSHAIFMTGDGRIELLSAVRAEKNAILTHDKVKAAEFSALSRQSMTRVKQIAAELQTLIGTNLATPEGKAVAELTSSLDEAEKNNNDVLQLAVVKSAVEGGALLHGQLCAQAQELSDFVSTLAETGGATRASDGSGPSGRIVAGRLAVGRFYELSSRLSHHFYMTTDRQRAETEAKISQTLAGLQAALRQFSTSLSEQERAEAAGALGSFEAIKAKVNQILALSRANTDAAAEELSSTKSVAIYNRCDGLFDDARKGLKARLAVEGSEVSSASDIGRKIVIWTAVIGALISLGLALLIIRSITGPVVAGVKVFEAIAGGDLTQRMSFDSHDEIGRLGAASDRMAVALCEVVTQIRQVAGQLGNSAAELSQVSTDLLSQSHEVSTQAESVASGTEQMSTNVSTMAAAAEEMSANVSSISSASEEVSVNVGTIVQSADGTSRSVGSVAESIARITASLQEVARDARHGSQVTQQAKELAVAATGTMRQLDQAASDITKVTEVIKSIALQTNLLALNATIEATSAGEAGKGFAVVAGEVKELASQSAQSAEEIARRIESVQATTRDAVKVIENVAQFVEQVNESAGRISESVDGQTRAAAQIESAVTQARQGVESIARSIAEVGKGATDVSRNTSEVASAATDVSRNASEAAKAAETISSNIHGVSEATRLSTASAAQLNEAAKQLAQLATQLGRLVARFHVGDGAVTQHA